MEALKIEMSGNIVSCRQIMEGEEERAALTSVHFAGLPRPRTIQKTIEIFLTIET